MKLCSAVNIDRRAPLLSFVITFTNSNRVYAKLDMEHDKGSPSYPKKRYGRQKGVEQNGNNHRSGHKRFRRTGSGEMQRSKSEKQRKGLTMKSLKRVFTMVLVFMLFFSTLEIQPMTAIQAASKSSTEKEIEKLENDIKKWKKELEEYQKKSDKATKGAIGIIAGGIANFDPLIMDGGIMHPEVPYLHVTNYTPDFTEGLIGAISGFFRKTGTYTYEFKGKIVPDYEKIYDYGDEVSALKDKIAKAEKKLEALKADLNAELILVNEKKVTMGKGENFSIWYELSEDVSDSTITWISSDKAVATVSTLGIIKAKGIGTAKITGKAKVNGKTVTMNVTVKEKAESISLKTKSLELTSGETKQLKPTFSPAKSFVNVSWLCSDTSVATVNPDTGVLTAVAPGTAYVYAFSYYAKKVSNACKVTVKGENLSYKKASSEAAAISMVKASGYLEDGIDYFFETINIEDEFYTITAYSDTDEYVKRYSGASKKAIGDLGWEIYYIEANGKKVYCLDQFKQPDQVLDAIINDTFDPKDYAMLKGLKFETTSISVPQDAYQRLVLKAKNIGKFDYLRITSADPDVAEIVFSEQTGEAYVKGKKQGKTTITAEAKNGQKAVLQVEVNGKMKSKDEALKEANDAWVKENANQANTEPGDGDAYQNMVMYEWWSDWYAANDLEKIDMFYDEFGDESNDDYEARQSAYANPKEWAKQIIDLYLSGMSLWEVDEMYEYYSNIYDNNLGKEMDPDDIDWSDDWRYENYIQEATEKYERENEQYICEDPITAETFQKKHKSNEAYTDNVDMPFSKYYVLLEKDSGAFVFAAQGWYRMKKWVIKEKFLE